MWFLYVVIFIAVIAIVVVVVRSSRRETLAKEAKKLQDIFSLKEGSEKYLANLEGLGQEDSVSQELYGSMKENYQQRLAQATSQISTIKDSLKGELEHRQRKLEAYELELKRLSLRLKVGELPSKAYLHSERKLRKNVKQTESEVEEIKTLLAAQSSVEALGYRGIHKIPAQKIPAPRVEKVSPPRKAEPRFQAKAFTQFITSTSDIVTPRTRLLGLIGGVVLIVSVFLKWASTKPIMGISFSFSGSDLSTALLAVAIACGVIALVGTFLAQSQPRGIVHIAVGAVGLIALLVVWFSGPSVPVELSEFEQSAQQELMEMVTIREGLYLYVISAIAILVGGALNLRRASKGKMPIPKEALSE